jgi:hypothetical protein
LPGLNPSPSAQNPPLPESIDFGIVDLGS